MWWVAAAGLAMQVYGQYSSSKAEAEALADQAALGKAKAAEILRRNEVNTGLLWDTTEGVAGEQSVALAGSGFSQDVSSFAMMEGAYRKAANQVIRDTEEAEWSASMAIAGADIQVESSRDIARAGQISALGTTAVQSARIWSSYGGGSESADGEM